MSQTSQGHKSQTSQGRKSQTSTSQESVYPADPQAYEAHKAQHEKPIVAANLVPNIFLRDLYDISLLSLYAKHVVRHV